MAFVDRARPRPLAVIHSHSLKVISHQLSAITQEARLRADGLKEEATVGFA